MIIDKDGKPMSAQWWAEENAQQDRLYPLFHAVVQEVVDNEVEIGPEQGEQKFLKSRETWDRLCRERGVSPPALHPDEVFIVKNEHMENVAVVPVYVVDKRRELAHEPRVCVALPPEDPDGKYEEEDVADDLMEVAREIKARGGSWLECGLPTAAYLTHLAEAYRALRDCYYIHRSLNSNLRRATENPADNTLRENWERRLVGAKGAMETLLVWACQTALKGTPEAISTFYVVPIGSIRKSNGEYLRIMEFHSQNGKVWRLELTGEDYHSPAYLRRTLNTKAGGVWMAGERELEKLQADVSAKLEKNEIHEVTVMGWVQEIQMNGYTLPVRAWFFRDCAIDYKGRLSVVDAHDIVGLLCPKSGVSGGEVYRKFKVGNLAATNPDREWLMGAIHLLGVENPDKPEPLADVDIANLLGEVARRTYDTVGSFSGYQLLGVSLAYAAAVEIFAKYRQFPGVWIHGEASQGKSAVGLWATGMWGLLKPATLMGATGAGTETVFEQYANLPIPLDEAQTGIKPQLLELLRDCYNRMLSPKLTNVLRQIRTAPIVIGVATSDDDQTRSRYPHVLVNEAVRCPRAGDLVEDATAEGGIRTMTAAEAAENQRLNFEWMEDNKEFFRRIGRWHLEHREAYAEEVMKRLREWQISPQTKGLDVRTKFVMGVGLAGFMTSMTMLKVETLPVRITTSEGTITNQVPLAEFEVVFRRFLLENTRQSVAEARENSGVDRFLRDIATGFGRGAFGTDPAKWGDYFRVVSDVEEEGPPKTMEGSPQRTYAWRRWTLLIRPDEVYSALLELKGKERRIYEATPLRLNDLRSQIKGKEFWVKQEDEMGKGKKLRQRFGGKLGSYWAIDLDKCPKHGYLPTSDAEFAFWLEQIEQAMKYATPELLVVGGEAIAKVVRGEQESDATDPRKGPLILMCEKLSAAGHEIFKRG